MGQKNNDRRGHKSQERKSPRLLLPGAGGPRLALEWG